MQYDNQDKIQTSTSAPTPAGSAPKAANPATNPLQQPTWTQAAGVSGWTFNPTRGSSSQPSLNLPPDYIDPEVKKAQQAVRTWLDNSTQNLMLHAMVDLIRQVRVNVPGASVLADGEIQIIIQQWADDNGITIPAISVFPGSGGAQPPANQPTTSLADSDIVSSISKAFGKIPSELKVERSYGKAVINATGATIDLGSRDQRIGGSLKWNGEMGIKASSSGLSFEGSLTKDTWNLKASFTVGSAVPNLSDLATIFEKGLQGLNGGVDEISKGLAQSKDISAIKERVSPYWDEVDKAVKTASQIAKVKAGKVSVSVEAGAKGPSFGGGPQPPVGAEAKVMVTFTW
jgi:hypothetical protein